jgi:methyl-accepting chemotaxis protein
MMDKNKKNPKVEDDEVMITSSISDLEKMLESVEKHADQRTDTKFEKFFLPALTVFGAIIIGFFVVIYSITSDMARLANSMDPNMGGNMSSMVKSIDSLSNNVGQMTVFIDHIQKDFHLVDQNMDIIASKLDNLDSIAADLTQVSLKMDSLAPMLVNMKKMNKNMANMQDSMQWMKRDINIMRYSIVKPLRIFNKIPML